MKQVWEVKILTLREFNPLLTHFGRDVNQQIINQSINCTYTGTWTIGQIFCGYFGHYLDINQALQIKQKIFTAKQTGNFLPKPTVRLNT